MVIMNFEFDAVLSAASLLRAVVYFELRDGLCSGNVLMVGSRSTQRL